MTSTVVESLNHFFTKLEPLNPPNRSAYVEKPVVGKSKVLGVTAGVGRIPISIRYPLRWQNQVEKDLHILCISDWRQTA